MTHKAACRWGSRKFVTAILLPAMCGFPLRRHDLKETDTSRRAWLSYKVAIICRHWCQTKEKKQQLGPHVWETKMYTSSNADLSVVNQYGIRVESRGLTLLVCWLQSNTAACTVCSTEKRTWKSDRKEKWVGILREREWESSKLIHSCL